MSLLGQTRVRLGCLRPGPNEVHSARLFAAPDIAIIDVGVYSLSPKTLLLTHASIYYNDPSTLSASDFAQEASSNLHERDLFCVLTKI